MAFPKTVKRVVVLERDGSAREVYRKKRRERVRRRDQRRVAVARLATSAPSPTPEDGKRE